MTFLERKKNLHKSQQHPSTESLENNQNTKKSFVKIIIFIVDAITSSSTKRRNKKIYNKD